MRDKGFPEARALRGGFDAWVKRGYPLSDK